MKKSQSLNENPEKNPSEDRVEAHNDEELVQMAWDAIEVSSIAIRSLKENYRDLPRELEPHREYYKKLLETSTQFLVDTGNWYKNNTEC